MPEAVWCRHAFSGSGGGRILTPRFTVLFTACITAVGFIVLKEHEMKVCPHREVPCKRAHLGCDVILPVYQLGLHEDHGCRYRGIACPLGCGREFRQDEKNRHLVRGSSRRCSDVVTGLSAFPRCRSTRASFEL